MCISGSHCFADTAISEERPCCFFNLNRCTTTYSTRQITIPNGWDGIK